MSTPSTLHVMPSVASFAPSSLTTVVHHPLEDDTTWLVQELSTHIRAASPPSPTRSTRPSSVDTADQIALNDIVEKITQHTYPPTCTRSTSNDDNHVFVHAEMVTTPGAPPTVNSWTVLESCQPHWRIGVGSLVCMVTEEGCKDCSFVRGVDAVDRVRVRFTVESKKHNFYLTIPLVWAEVGWVAGKLIPFLYFFVTSPSFSPLSFISRKPYKVFDDCDHIHRILNPPPSPIAFRM